MFDDVGSIFFGEGGGSTNCNKSLQVTLETRFNFGARLRFECDFASDFGARFGDFGKILKRFKFFWKDFGGTNND